MTSEFKHKPGASALPKRGAFSKLLEVHEAFVEAYDGDDKALTPCPRCGSKAVENHGHPGPLRIMVGLFLMLLGALFFITIIGILPGIGFMGIGGLMIYGGNKCSACKFQWRALDVKAWAKAQPK